MAKRKRNSLRLSKAERNRRRLQALRNFGHRKKSKRRVVNMARRRTRRSGGRKGFGDFKPVVGAVGLAVADPLLQQLASKFGFGASDDVARGLVALVAKKTVKNKYVTATADAQLVLSARSLVANMNLGNFMNTSSTQQTNSNDGWE